MLSGAHLRMIAPEPFFLLAPALCAIAAAIAFPNLAALSFIKAGMAQASTITCAALAAFFPVAAAIAFARLA
jgi:hypothetical protein